MEKALIWCDINIKIGLFLIEKMYSSDSRNLKAELHYYSMVRIVHHNPAVLIASIHRKGHLDRIRSEI